MRRLDLAKIRREQNVTQKRLAEITTYPQGFISQIENGKAKAPIAFVQKLQEILGIDDIEPYLIEDNSKEQSAEEAVIEALMTSPPQPSNPSNEAQITLNFLALLQKKEEKIEELEKRIAELEAKLKRYKSKSRLKDD